MMVMMVMVMVVVVVVEVIVLIMVMMNVEGDYIEGNDVKVGYDANVIS